MFQFDYFYKNWLDPSNIFEPGNVLEDHETDININLSENFFENLKFSRQNLLEYRIEAALQAARALGDKPALCLSGGVDSQAMVQCFTEAGIKADIYLLVFKNNLNFHDVATAREYCNKFNLTLNEIEIDIKRFLQRENYDYGLKYRCASPHFNTHYKLFNFLKDIGHTGVCAGGDIAYKVDDYWTGNFRRNSLDFITYSQVENFPVIGNFLSYYPNLSWAISILTKPFQPPIKKYGAFDMNTVAESKNRYHDKLNAYLRSGINFIAQPKKFTGFELVKIEYQYITNDPMEFEKRFRKPLEDIYKPRLSGIKLSLSEKQLEEVHMLQCNNFSGSVFFSKFGLIKDSFSQNPFYIDDLRAWG